MQQLSEVNQDMEQTSIVSLIPELAEEFPLEFALQFMVPGTKVLVLILQDRWIWMNDCFVTNIGGLLEFHITITECTSISWPYLLKILCLTSTFTERSHSPRYYYCGI